MPRRRVAKWPDMGATSKRRGWLVDKVRQNGEAHAVSSLTTTARVPTFVARIPHSGLSYRRVARSKSSAASERRMCERIKRVEELQPHFGSYSPWPRRGVAPLVPMIEHLRYAM